MKKKSGVRNLIITAASLTGLMTPQVACGSAENSSLPGAVYAKVVPVYPGAKEDVVAFYKNNLPGAELKRDNAGDPTFTLIPDGAEEGEHVQVIFRKSGDLQIHESLKPGKRQG